LPFFLCAYCPMTNHRSSLGIHIRGNLSRR
jgi:hypothetical protein